MRSRTDATVTAFFATYAIFLALATKWYSFDLWGALVVGPVLAALSLPVLRRISGTNSDLFQLLVLALLVKLAMAVPRWAMAFLLYDGTADAARYDAAGKDLAPFYRAGVLVWPDSPGGFGTQVMEAVTGAVYAVIGPTILGGFVFYAWLGFWGLVALHRAACLAVPQLDERRYAVLVFFLPSMVFWPSSIGKESLLTFGLGLTALGAARLFTYRRGALAVVVTGLGTIFFIRPHVAAMLVIAILAGYLVRRPRRQTPLTPVLRLGGTAILVTAGVFVLYQAAADLGLEGLDPSAASEEIERRGANTSQGGSEFTAEPISSPLDVPGAVLAVFFRPFPWEARNPQVLVAAAESSGLLALVVLSWRRVAAVAGVWRNPYVAFAVVYLTAFLYAFSAFGNFGILARQRVQALPFLVLLLALRPRGDVPPPSGPRYRARRLVG